jgi:hypothetical protein
MSAPDPPQVLRQMFSAFDQGDWTIFDRHPGLYETRQHLPHLYSAFPDLHHTISWCNTTRTGTLAASVIHPRHQKIARSIQQERKTHAR